MDITIICALIGVGGTILGTIIGAFLPLLVGKISNYGKLKVYQVATKINYMELGGSNRVEIENLVSFKMAITIDVYNKSKEIKIMRDIKLLLCCDNQENLVAVPNDLKSQRGNGVTYNISQFHNINFQPQTLQTLYCEINCKGDIKQIFKSDKLMLEYIDEREEEHKVQISNINMFDMFENYDLE